MTLKKCPKCGTEVQKDSPVCSKCGFPIKFRTQEKEKNTLFKEIINNKIFIICQILVGLCLLYFSCYNIYVECRIFCEFKSINHYYVALALILLSLSIPLVFIGLKKLNMKKSACYSITVLLFAFFPITIVKGCYDEAKWQEYGNTNVEITKNTRKRFASVENMQEDLEGTVWTWTEPLSDADRANVKTWVRFEFKNNKLYIQSAYPSNGKWGNAREHTYTIKENRDFNNGKKYIGVFITGGHYFVPSTGFYNQPGLYEVHKRVMRERDYTWD